MTIENEMAANIRVNTRLDGPTLILAPIPTLFVAVREVMGLRASTVDNTRPILSAQLSEKLDR
jgi:hypothetical protein